MLKFTILFTICLLACDTAPNDQWKDLAMNKLKQDLKTDFTYSCLSMYGDNNDSFRCIIDLDNKLYKSVCYYNSANKYYCILAGDNGY